MNKTERAALLRARHAGRYDSLGRKGTSEEYAEEQAAARVKIPSELWFDLMQRGLVTPPPTRLTDAGRAALGAELKRLTSKGRAAARKGR